MAEIVATTSLPVDSLMATDCNAAARANNDENSGPLTVLPVYRLTATDCNGDRSCLFQSDVLPGWCTSNNEEKPPTMSPADMKHCSIEVSNIVTYNIVHLMSVIL